MPAKSTTKTAPKAKAARKVTRSKPAAKPAAQATKAGPEPSAVAKLRREGATWQQTRDHFGVKTSSGAFTKALNVAGFDAAGLKLDGSGPRESKARVAKPKAA
jgi:hypothetical protein